MKLERTRRFFKRHFLSVILIALAAPLAVILVMQYRSLRALEHTLPIYRRELLLQYLNTVTDHVRKLYSDNSERVLALRVETLSLSKEAVIHDDPGRTRVVEAAKQAAEFFRQQEFKGALRFFVALATDRNGISHDEVLFYDPAKNQMVFDDQAAEMQAIHVACAPYLIYVRGRVEVIPQSMAINRDAAHPLIVKPVLNNEKRIVGIAGMTLDQAWFEREVVPAAIETTLTAYFPAERRNASITLRAGDDSVIYSNREGDDAPPEVTTHFSFVFFSYTVGIRMLDLSIQQWARRNVIVNLSLSLAMTVIMAGGLFIGWRAAKREIRLVQMKTDFVANVSHELRTPLASIRVFAEMLKLGRVTSDERVRDYGSHIESLGLQLTGLINNILDFSSIESGQKSYQRSPTDLHSLIDEVLETCAARLEQGGHRIDFERDNPPITVVVDLAALQLALTNLLDNAIKYSAEGTVITIRLGCEKGFAFISVRDHGLGIPPSELNKIFDKFYRVSTGMVHNVKGSGLGLAIVRHIVEAHQGRITVDSQPGRGSTFTIYLPIEDRSDFSEDKSRLSDQDDKRGRHGVTVLEPRS